jgi:hypothetical protein
MITLDPDFVGSLAPPSKLTYTNTTAASDKSGRQKAPVEGDILFRNLPRLERLRVQGKADETEIIEESEEEDSSNDVNGGKTDKRVEKEKMKMRGKGKALKRYLKKKRKNIIEPSTVSYRPFGGSAETNSLPLILDCDPREAGETSGGTKASQGTGKKAGGGYGTSVAEAIRARSI